MAPLRPHAPSPSARRCAPSTLNHAKWAHAPECHSSSIIEPSGIVTGMNLDSSRACDGNGITRHGNQDPSCRQSRWSPLSCRFSRQTIIQHSEENRNSSCSGKHPCNSYLYADGASRRGTFCTALHACHRAWGIPPHGGHCMPDSTQHGPFAHVPEQHRHQCG
jgi:hypothetical protein